MQDEPRGESAAPDKFAEPDPAVAVMVPPPHDPVRPLDVETIRPAGSVSVNATPFSAGVALGLLMVNESEVVPPTEIDAAPNDLEMVGADGPDVMVNGMPLLVPPGVVTVTSTVPLPAGTVAVMLVGLLTVNEAAVLNIDRRGAGEVGAYDRQRRAGGAAGRAQRNYRRDLSQRHAGRQ